MAPRPRNDARHHRNDIVAGRLTRSLGRNKKRCYVGEVKTTRYFDALRKRPDRAAIRDEWIERAIRHPVKETMQADGHIRRWVQVPEAQNRYLRVVLLADGETVHNAFFDRRFVP